jgi:hypothetical protein
MVVVNNNSTTESPLYFGEGIAISYSFVSKNSTLTSIHVHLPSNAQDRIYALEVKIATYWNAALPILEHIKSRTD